MKFRDEEVEYIFNELPLYFTMGSKTIITIEKILDLSKEYNEMALQNEGRVCGGVVE